MCCLARQPAVEPPVAAALAAAPDVGVHEDDAAVEDRGQRLLPLALPGVLVGAVGPQQRGRRPVERGVAVPHDGGRHRGPVRRGEGAHLGDVRRGVVARGLVAVRVGHRAVGQRDLRVHDRLGVGLVGDRHRGRVVPGVARQPDLAADEAAGDVGAGSGQVVGGQHAQHAVAAATQRRHDVPLERVDPLQPLGRVLGPDLTPGRVVLPAGTGERTGRQPELDRVVVGDQEEVTVPDVLGAVHHPGPPAAERAGDQVGAGRVDVPRLRGVAALAEHHDGLLAAAPPEGHLVAAVGLHEHVDVGRHGVAEPVGADPLVPPRRVGHGVEEPGCPRSPTSRRRCSRRPRRRRAGRRRSAGRGSAA